MTDPTQNRPTRTTNGAPKSRIIESNTKKRKREDLDESNPKLREFLQVMQPSRAKGQEILEEEHPQKVVPEDDSDGEYESIPNKKRQTTTQEPYIPSIPSMPAATPPQNSTQLEKTPVAIKQQAIEPPTSSAPAIASTGDATDDEWLRSRTNRLLDLMDVDELVAPAVPAQDTSIPVPVGDNSVSGPESSHAAGDESATGEATAEDPALELAVEDPAVESIRQTSRLYVRNLPYRVTEDDLAGCFEKFGELEQVRAFLSSH